MTDRRSLSLWWDALPDDLAGPARPPLPEDREADVVIVGAGYTGLWTAYWLLRADPRIRVVVLEQEVAGFGASGRAGGWCSALFPTSPQAMAEASSRDSTLRMLRTMERSVGEIGEVCAADGIECGYAEGGTIALARTAVQEQRARARLAEARGWDAGDVWLDADAARRRLSATNVRGATFTSHCAAVDPARLVRGLALAVERLGGVVHEGTRATSLEPGIVRTDHGTVRAEHVVRATEAFTARLPGLRRAIAPVYSLMLATEPLTEQIWDQIGLQHRETFADHRRLIIYGQRTSDDRIAFGGRGAPYHYGSTIRPEHDRHDAVHADLRRTLVDLLPVLRDVRITHTWGGAVGVARDWAASVGLERRTGMAWAGGYVGDGITTAFLAGRTLADLIRGERSERVGLPWVGHRSPRWEPEPLRWLGTNIALRGVMAADAAEERTGRTSWRGRALDRVLGG